MILYCYNEIYCNYFNIINFILLENMIWKRNCIY